MFATFPFPPCSGFPISLQSKMIWSPEREQVRSVPIAETVSWSMTAPVTPAGFTWQTLLVRRLRVLESLIEHVVPRRRASP